MRIALLFLAFTTAPGFAQDIEIGLKTRNKGFSFEMYRFPDDIIVYDLERNKSTLEVGDLALIQIWSIDHGGQPPLWDRLVDIAERYRERGLETIGINFENGAELAGQHQNLRDFVAVRKPTHRICFDYLGYTIDLLKVPGFPSYMLVRDGSVVFTTLGEDEEGVDLLEDEIRRILEERGK